MHFSMQVVYNRFSDESYLLQIHFTEASHSVVGQVNSVQKVLY